MLLCFFFFFAEAGAVDAGDLLLTVLDLEEKVVGARGSPTAASLEE